MEWIKWEKQRPIKKGYYLFCIHSGGNSYSNHTDQEVGYYDPESPNYAMGGREFKENNMGEFFKIDAWMPLPPLPKE